MKPDRSSRVGPNALLWDEWRVASPQSLAGGKLPLWANEATGGQAAGAPLSA